MRRFARCTMLMLIGLLPALALAQPAKPGGAKAKEEVKATAEEKVVPATAAPAAAPAAKPEVVAAPLLDESEEITFQRLVGLYFEGRGGVFFTIGGARGYSNGQPFYGFELGYDFTPRFSAQISYASGYQAANPLLYPEECTLAAGCSDYHLDFGFTFFNLSADYDLMHGQRWAWEFRAGGGAVLINPSAQPDQAPVDFDVFGGMRLEYYTLLKHFTVGAEYDFYYVIQTGIPAMSVALSVLYNF